MNPVFIGKTCRQVKYRFSGKTSFYNKKLCLGIKISQYATTTIVHYFFGKTTQK